MRRWIVAVRIGCDALAYACAWISAWAIRVSVSDLVELPLNPAQIYWKSLPMIVFGCLLTSAAVGSYSTRRNGSPLEEGVRVVRAAFGSLLIVMSLGFLFKEYDYSRLLVVLFGVLSLMFLPIARAIASGFQGRLIKLGLLGTRVLILGAGEIGIRSLQKVQDHPEIGYRVVGFLDDDQAKQGGQIGRTPVLGPLSSLRETVDRERIDELIIAMPNLGQSQLMDLVMKVDDLPVKVRVVADLFGVLSHETRIDLIEDVPIYDLEGPDETLAYRLAKRIFDLVVGSLAGLLFVITFPFIAIAMKLDGPGDIFFVHERVGENGRIFKMWKYRTMAPETEAYAVAPREDTDPRVTRVGKFLRSTSLDELPQVINVLRGDMSIVGPRPEMPFIVEKYNEWQRKRLDVRPGITGLWQIMGRKDLPLHDNLEYDFYYIKNRSLLLDLVIVLRTIPATLSRKGAY